MDSDQLKRLAELLGWRYHEPSSGVNCTGKLITDDELVYMSPLDNGALMVWVMVEHKITVAAQTTGNWMAWPCFSDTSEAVIICGHPIEAALSCLLIKLEAQADEN